MILQLYQKVLKTCTFLINKKVKVQIFYCLAYQNKFELLMLIISKSSQMVIDSLIISISYKRHSTISDDLRENRRGIGNRKGI